MPKRLIYEEDAIAKFEPWLKVEGYSEGELNMLKAVLYELRFLPPAQPEIVRCKNCKYNPDNPRPFYDDDPIETYAWCKTEYFDEHGFCSCGKLAITLQ